MNNSGDVVMDMDPGWSSLSERHSGVDASILQFVGRDKGKAKEVVEPSTTPRVVETELDFGPITEFGLNSPTAKDSIDEILARITSSSVPSVAAAPKATKRGSETESEQTARLRRKEDIIQRAKERRHDIQENLNNIKRQLWETTVEQAALIHLTKKLEIEREVSNGAGQS